MTRPVRAPQNHWPPARGTAGRCYDGPGSQHAADLKPVGCSAFMRGGEKGIPLDLMLELLISQDVRLVGFDPDLAVRAAGLRPSTERDGLSFADRACIATAISREATMVTAGRAWITLDLPCPVELVR